MVMAMLIAERLNFGITGRHEIDLGFLFLFAVHGGCLC
jgi:hypothetical protein